MISRSIDGFLRLATELTRRFNFLALSVGRNVQETLRQVQAFQLLRKTKGAEATPPGWRHAKPTLKPGPALVGNVWKQWKTGMAFD